jgi:glycosyltransferase involved in cell wall biosynthesis
MPLISVITSVLNGNNTLEKAIKSVVSEKETLEIEYIVIDGGSTDGTINLLKKYDKVIDYWVSEPDSGIYCAWNKGLAKANGKYVAFLGADDYYCDGALAKYAEKIRNNLDLDYISSKVLFLDRRARIIGSSLNGEKSRRKINIAHVGSMHKMDLYKKYGNYDESLKIAGDYEFLYRVGDLIYSDFIDEVTVVMGGGGVSTSAATLALAETMLIKLRYNKCSKFIAYFDYFIGLIKVKLKYFIDLHKW